MSHVRLRYGHNGGHLTMAWQVILCTDVQISAGERHQRMSDFRDRLLSHGYKRKTYQYQYWKHSPCPPWRRELEESQESPAFSPRVTPPWSFTASSVKSWDDLCWMGGKCSEDGRGEGQVWSADMLLLHSNSNSQLSSIMLSTSIYIFQSHLGKIECGNHH